MGRIKAEYIWMDGHKPTSKLRSKTKIVEGPISKITDLPEWGFDDQVLCKQMEMIVTVL